MKIAAAQISCVPGDRETNLQKVRENSERAKNSGAELIVFPEMVDTGYSMPVIREHAERWNEGAVPELQKMAKELSIAIVCGISDREGDAIYNAQVLVGPDGRILAKYRKTHLVTATPLDERACFTAGNEFVSCKFDQFNFGLSICYDLRFPEVCRLLAVKHQVNVFLISSAWPAIRVAHLQYLARARAVENQSYLIVANRVGRDDNVTLGGSSLIVDPAGEILASGSLKNEQLLTGEISREVIDPIRDHMKVFDHRRAELY